MSGNNVIECGSFDEKIKDISSYLKDNVLEPAEKEKSEILKKAAEEKKEILANAEKEAQRIINEARKKAEDEKNNLESSLRIAAKKAVDVLKSSLEKEVLKQSIEKPSGNVLSSEDMLKEFISEIVNLTFSKNEESDLELILSDDMKSKLSNYIKSEINVKSKNKITISDERVPAGFNVVMKDSGLMYDFSNESLVELLSSYLRPNLRKFLFEK